MEIIKRLKILLGCYNFRDKLCHVKIKSIKSN